jgi:hypothetical protein
MKMAKSLTALPAAPLQVLKQQKPLRKKAERW